MRSCDSGCIAEVSCSSTTKGSLNFIKRTSQYDPIDIKKNPKAEQQYPIKDISFVTVENTLIMKCPNNENWTEVFEAFEDSRDITIWDISEKYKGIKIDDDADNNIEVLRDIYDNCDAVGHIVQEYCNEIDKFYKNCEKRKQAILKRGDIKFNEIPLVYKKGECIIVDTDYNTIQGAIISSISKDHFLGNAFWTVHCIALVLYGNKYLLRKEKYRIRYFSGSLKLTELNIRKPTDNDIDIVNRRISKFQKLAKVSSHMQYTGNMYRRNWFGVNQYCSDGRVIIDDISFWRFNGNYEDTYGDKVEEPTIELLFTIPPVVKGYSMRLKAWGEFDIDNLEDIEFNNDVFDLLVLDQDKKDIIHALVSSNTIFHDIVNGKGGGTIFLLYGGPGTGKTLTAEAVSEHLKRPLYMVSVGELGTTAVELESKLKDILELATAWNAILLIDEADIFLEERTSNDIERNAMVGIFLRLLEYYSGVLFLTTNRSDVLDIAFMSRISMMISYESLDIDARFKVWDILLKRQSIKLANAEINRLAKHDLNGRQIKNIIKMALGIADHKKTKVSMDTFIFIFDNAPTNITTK